MTSRERLQKVLKREPTDCVPVSPDTSNMIPAKLTGKPFWQLYLYQDPPIWKAYIDCVKHFGFDSLMDGYVSILFEDLGELNNEWTEVIVYRSDDRIITQQYRKANNLMEWSTRVIVYYIDNPPTPHVKPSDVGLSNIPSHWEPVEGVKQWTQGEALLKLVKQEMGDHGLVGVYSGYCNLVSNEEMIYDWYDNPEKYLEKRDRVIEESEKKLKKLMSLEHKPDFICTGSSGTLVFNNIDMFRKMGLHIVKKVTSMCKQYGIPSHIHSCGPEEQLVKICVEETDITVMDPLEVPPMGDCNLKEIKRLYGDKIVLKGNLHTTNVMLNGTVQDVINASKQAIDDAAYGGGFILSTGDQCGRDTPFENIHAMIETARTYGKY